jgi:competence protein ComEC
MVDTEPELTDTALNMRLSVREIAIDDRWERVSGNVLIHTRRYPSYRYGDVIKASGQLQDPPEFEEFNYRDYLARQGVHSTMLYPQIELLESGQGFKPKEWLYAIRERLSQELASALPEPQASLAQGILLGQRTTIPHDLNEAFSRTGTTHILAISGQNISIIAGMLMAFLAFVFGRNRLIYLLAALGAIWAYAILAGMAPSIQRAALMASLALMATHLGRQNSAITSLVFAAAVLSGLQPLVLWDVAFQLSFVAMAGLILMTPLLETPIRKALEKSKVKKIAASPVVNIIIQSCSATLGATLATLPIIAFNFHRISLVALPATLLALPTLPPIIMTTALVGITGLFSPPLAQAASWLAWLCLAYMIKIVTLFSNMPLASVNISGISQPIVWGYYAGFAAIIWFSSNIRRFPNDILSFVKRQVVEIMRPTRWLIAPLALAALLIWLAAFAPLDNRLHVSFLDVGQGDAILIQTPSHYNILIDGGPSPQDIGLELGRKLPFWDKGIDLVVLTHPQDDHLLGLIEVLRRYNVKQVLESGLAPDTANYEEWLKAIEEGKVKRNLTEVGQRVRLGSDIELEVLQPEKPFLRGTPADVNNNSVVLRLTCGNASFLLPGDIEEEAENRLLAQRANIKGTVLKVAHHGAKTASSSRFLAAVDPQVAIISVGAENRFGHPHQETLDRLTNINIYRTDLQGTIEIITDGRKLWIKTER